MSQEFYLSELGKFLVAASFNAKIRQYLRDEPCLSMREEDLEKLFSVLRQVDNESWRRGEEEVALAVRHGVKIVTLDSPQYPRRLREIPDPPLVLFVRGALPVDGELIVGIVGTRGATPYGKKQAFRFGKEITACGGIVVSGLAYGVDKAAHEGAVHAVRSAHDVPPTPGVAVLGTGVLSVYPPEHVPLADSMLGCGGAVISEYPLFLGPRPHTFPARNRIISGLADAVIIVEAPERSGALITARCALEQGRDVFSIPGPLESKNSAGTNLLIRQGAVLLRDLEDLFEAMPKMKKTTCYRPDPGHLEGAKKKRLRTSEKSEPLLAIPDQLDTNEKDIAAKVIVLLSRQELCQIDFLIQELNQPPAVIQSTLMQMELLGLVFSRPGQNYTLSEFVET